MGFEVASRCGRQVAAGDAGTSVRCDGGGEVAVPSLSDLRRSVPPPPVVLPKWESPRVGPRRLGPTYNTFTARPTLGRV